MHPLDHDDIDVSRPEERTPARTSRSVVAFAAVLSLIVVAGALYYNHKSTSSNRQVDTRASERQVGTAAPVGNLPVRGAAGLEADSDPTAPETLDTAGTGEGTHPTPTLTPNPVFGEVWPSSEGFVAIDAAMGLHYFPPDDGEPMQLTEGGLFRSDEGIHETVFDIIDYRGRRAVLIDHLDFGYTSNQPFEELRVYPVEETSSGVDNYVVLEHREWPHFGVDWYYNETAEQYGDVLWVEREFNQGACYFIDALDLDGNIVDDPNNPAPRPSPEVLQSLTTNWDDPACPNERNILPPPPAPRVYGAVVADRPQESVAPDLSEFTFLSQNLDPLSGSPEPGTAVYGVPPRSGIGEEVVVYFPLDGGDPIMILGAEEIYAAPKTSVGDDLKGVIDYHGVPAVVVEHREMELVSSRPQGTTELRLYPVEETGRVGDYVVWEQRTLLDNAARFFTASVEQHGDVIWVTRTYKWGFCNFIDVLDLDGTLIDDPNNPSPRPDLEKLRKIEFESGSDRSNCSG